jgi:hypothetical protein
MRMEEKGVGRGIGESEGGERDLLRILVRGYLGTKLQS